MSTLTALTDVSPRLPLWQNGVSTILTGNITSSDLSIEVYSADAFPTPTNLYEYGTFTITDGTNTEIVKYQHKSGDTLTGCTRGTEGTTAQSFAAGSKVEVRFTAGHIQDLVYKNQVMAPITGVDVLKTPTDMGSATYLTTGVNSKGLPYVMVQNGSSWSVVGLSDLLTKGSTGPGVGATSSFGVNLQASFLLSGLGEVSSTSVNGISKKTAVVRFLSGTHAGKVRVISSVSGMTVNFSPALPSVVAENTSFEIFSEPSSSRLAGEVYLLQSGARFSAGAVSLSTLGRDGEAITAINLGGEWQFPQYPEVLVDSTAATSIGITSVTFSGSELDLVKDTQAKSYLIELSYNNHYQYRVISSFTTLSVTWSMGTFPEVSQSSSSTPGTYTFPVGTRVRIFEHTKATLKRIAAQTLADSIEASTSLISPLVAKLLQIKTLPGDFGAPVDGTTDASDSIKDALLSGYDVDGLGLTYKLSSPISITTAELAGKTPKLKNAVLDISSLPNDAETWGITFQGVGKVTGTSYLLAPRSVPASGEPLVTGDLLLVEGDASATISIGDWIQIESESFKYSNTTSSFIKYKTLRKVRFISYSSTSSTTTIGINSAIEVDILPISTTNTSCVYKYETLGGVSLTDVTFKGADYTVDPTLGESETGVTNVGCLKLLNCEGAELVNLDSVNRPKLGVLGMEGSVDCEVRGSKNYNGRKAYPVITLSKGSTSPKLSEISSEGGSLLYAPASKTSSVINDYHLVISNAQVKGLTLSGSNAYTIYGDQEVLWENLSLAEVSSELVKGSVSVSESVQLTTLSADIRNIHLRTFYTTAARIYTPFFLDVSRAKSRLHLSGVLLGRSFAPGSSTSFGLDIGINDKCSLVSISEVKRFYDSQYLLSSGGSSLTEDITYGIYVGIRAHSTSTTVVEDLELLNNHLDDCSSGLTITCYNSSKIDRGIATGRYWGGYGNGISLNDCTNMQLDVHASSASTAGSVALSGAGAIRLAYCDNIVVKGSAFCEMVGVNCIDSTKVHINRVETMPGFLDYDRSGVTTGFKVNGEYILSHTFTWGTATTFDTFGTQASGTMDLDFPGSSFYSASADKAKIIDANARAAIPDKWGAIVELHQVLYTPGRFSFTIYSNKSDLSFTAGEEVTIKVWVRTA